MGGTFFAFFGSKLRDKNMENIMNDTKSEAKGNQFEPTGYKIDAFTEICWSPSEGCFSDVRGPKIQKISPQMFRTKIVHTSGTFFEFFLKNIEKYL